MDYRYERYYKKQSKKKGSVHSANTIVNILIVGVIICTIGALVWFGSSLLKDSPAQEYIKASLENQAKTICEQIATAYNTKDSNSISIDPNEMGFYSEATLNELNNVKTSIATLEKKEYDLTDLYAKAGESTLSSLESTNKILNGESDLSPDLCPYEKGTKEYDMVLEKLRLKYSDCKDATGIYHVTSENIGLTAGTDKEIIERENHYYIKYADLNFQDSQVKEVYINGIPVDIFKKDVADYSNFILMQQLGVTDENTLVPTQFVALDEPQGYKAVYKTKYGITLRILIEIDEDKISNISCSLE